MGVDLGCFNKDCVKAYADAYGFPESYVALDCETTGLQLDRDLVVQIGWCVVKNRVSVENQALVIDQFIDKAAREREMIRGWLQTTQARMIEKKANYPWNEHVLTSRGVPPAVAVTKVVAACGESDYCLSHFGLNFDFPMISRLFSSYSDFQLPLASSGRLLDSALIFRAARLGINPQKGEPIDQFMNRVAKIRAYGKFSLATCLDFFGLEKHGAEREHAHDAAYDSWLSSLVFEELRKVAEGTKSE